MQQYLTTKFSAVILGDCQTISLHFSSVPRKLNFLELLVSNICALTIDTALLVLLTELMVLYLLGNQKL